jgi:hypothetical protein
MALTDVVSPTGVSFADRGDIGTVEDVVTSNGSDKMFLDVPTVGQVQSGVQYGQQGTELTGTYTGSGATTYSRSRVVNK